MDCVGGEQGESAPGNAGQLASDPEGRRERFGAKRNPI